MSAFLESKKNDLASELIEQIGNPIDANSVLIALEMTGVTSFSAQSKYGEHSLEDLAEDIYRKCKVLTLRKTKTIIRERFIFLKSIQRFLVSFLTGLELSVPMIVQMTSIMLLGFSMWAYIGFETRLSTFIAIGTFCSYVVTGGFVQGIGRKGLQYLSWENPVLAKKGVYKIYREAVFMILLFGALMCLILLIFTWKTNVSWAFISLSYYFMLAFLWLNLALLYIRRRSIATLLTVLIPLGVIWMLLRFRVTNIIVAQILGLFLADLLSFFWGYARFYVLSPESEKLLSHAKLPPNVWFRESFRRYFLFGIFYFAFIMADRIVNWSFSFSGNSFLFNTSYEVGLDFALICFPIFLILIEYATRELFGRVLVIERNLRSTQIKEFNHRFTIYYMVTMMLIPFFAMFFFLLVKQFFWMLYSSFSIQIIQPLFSDPITQYSFDFAYFSYCFVGMGLFNSQLQFSHSRPHMPLKAAFAGFLVNVVVGALLSWRFSPKYSVIGLFVGSVVFFFLTTAENFKLMEEFDYASYAA
jgi:hypothetical protein